MKEQAVDILLLMPSSESETQKKKNIPHRLITVPYYRNRNRNSVLPLFFTKSTRSSYVSVPGEESD